MCSKVSVINIASSSLENAKEVTNVHLMPCKIQYDGEAKIEEYFQSTIISSKGQADGAHYKATFHGRILQGETIDLPTGYCGYVLKEERKPTTEDEDRIFKASKKFSNLTYWNLEDEPSVNDKIIKALQWIDISSAIHRPVRELPEDSKSGIKQ